MFSGIHVKVGYEVAKWDCSLEELSLILASLGVLTGFPGVFEPGGDFCSHGSLGLRQSLRLVVLRSMEVDTVSARVAVDVVSVHRFLRSCWVTQMAHGCVLPRVLAAVEEENIVTLDIEAAIVSVGFISASFDPLSENPIAIIGPKVDVNSPGPKRLFIVGCLEEAELRAILPRPLATCTFGVDLRVAEGHGIVAIISDASILGELCSRVHQAVFRSCSSLESFTHGCACAVLDAHCEDVGIEEEEIAIVNRSRNVEKIRDILVTLLGLQLMLSNHDRGLDGITALWTRLVRSHEDV